MPDVYRSLRYAEAPIRTRRLDDSSKGARRYEFVISTERAAADGGVVLMSGAMLDDYRERPVVLLGHDHTQPIGRSVVTVERDRMRATVEIAPDHVLSDEARRNLDFMDWAGFGSASIGFRIEDVDWSPSAAERERFGLPVGGWIARTWHLVEWSIVNVPSDSGALLEGREALAFCRAAGASFLARFNSDGDDDLTPFESNLADAFRVPHESEAEQLAELGRVFRQVNRTLRRAL